MSRQHHHTTEYTAEPLEEKIRVYCVFLRDAIVEAPRPPTARDIAPIVRTFNTMALSVFTPSKDVDLYCKGFGRLLEYLHVLHAANIPAQFDLLCAFQLLLTICSALCPKDSTEQLRLDALVGEVAHFILDI